RLAAGVQMTDITFYKPESRPVLLTHLNAYVIKIVTMPSGEIIKPDNRLPMAQQSFQQIGANEAGATGHQPLTWFLQQPRQRVLVICSHNSVSVLPLALPGV